MPGSIQQEVRQAGAGRWLAQRKPVNALFGQHVLAELCGQGRQALHQRRVTQLRRRRQARTRAYEVAVHLLQQALLFGAQPELRGTGQHGLETCKQRSVHVDGIGVRGHRFGHLPLHLLQCLRGLGSAQVVEHIFDAPEQASGRIEADDGVVEIRRFGLPGDGIELVTVLLHRLAQRRPEMLGPQGIEWRQTVRGSPRLKQRIERGHG